MSFWTSKTQKALQNQPSPKRSATFMSLAGNQFIIQRPVRYLSESSKIKASVRRDQRAGLENIQEYIIKDQSTQVYAAKAHDEGSHAASHTTHQPKYEHEYGQYVYGCPKFANCRRNRNFSKKNV